MTACFWTFCSGLRPLYRKASSVGVFVWARPRFLVVLLFLCGETQIWLGDLRVVLPWLFVCFCLGIDMPSFLILANCAEYRLFHRLCIYQDRATEHLRPNRRKKRLKESLAVLRAEMNEGGADVNFSARGLSDVCTYIALSHNHFSNTHGSDISPLEYSTQRKLSKPSFAMFGSTVLAELPDGLRAQSPNETRSIEACFVHSGLDTGLLFRVYCELMESWF